MRCSAPHFLLNPLRLDMPCGFDDIGVIFAQGALKLFFIGKYPDAQLAVFADKLAQLARRAGTLEPLGCVAVVAHPDNESVASGYLCDLVKTFFSQFGFSKLKSPCRPKLIRLIWVDQLHFHYQGKVDPYKKHPIAQICTLS